jgi:hypothetical protein
MTACSFAVSAHVCWNWAVRGGTDRHPTVYPGSYVEYVQKLGHEAPGSIRRFCRALVQRLAEWISKTSSQLKPRGREGDPRTQHLQSLTAKIRAPQKPTSGQRRRESALERTVLPDRREVVCRPARCMIDVRPSMLPVVGSEAHNVHLHSLSS